jgi:hypothetical protein
MAAHEPATQRQLAYIKQLAYSRGVSFVPPATRRQASRLIEQLKQRSPSPRFEIADDRHATVLGRGEHAPASTPRADEIKGYGSHAHWRHSRPPRR